MTPFKHRVWAVQSGVWPRVLLLIMDLVGIHFSMSRGHWILSPLVAQVLASALVIVVEVGAFVFNRRWDREARARFAFQRQCSEMGSLARVRSQLADDFGGAFVRVTS
jgi:hypothetical protein